MKKKVLISVLSIALVLCCAIGATLAWLTAQSNTVTNTFTVGKVTIDLWESTLATDGTLASPHTTANSYKMVPGSTLAKDPTVTVKAGSEPCYLFVKVEKENNFDTFMEYAMDENWEAVTGVDGVWKYKGEALDLCLEADVDVNVIKDKKVTVKSSVTATQLDAVGTNLPALKFTAYAIQKDNLTVTDAKDVWNLIQSSLTTTD